MEKVECEKQLYQAATEITFKVLISILGSLSNIVIVLTLSRSRKLRSNNTLFLCSLSVAGLCFSLVSSPLSSTISFKWYNGNCAWDIVQVNRIIYHVAFSASIFTLTLMSLERSYVICNPLKYKLRITDTKVKWVIGMIWLTSITVGITEAFQLFTHIIESILTIVTVTSCYVIIVTCYVFMFAAIKRQRKIHQDNESTRKTLVNIRRKTEKELAKTIGLIVGVFALTWSPIAYTVAASPHLDRHGGDGSLSHWAYAVGMASSVLNPLIYFFRSREFRKASKDLICPRGFLCYDNNIQSMGDLSTMAGKSLPFEKSNTRSKCMVTDNMYRDNIQTN